MSGTSGDNVSTVDGQSFIDSNLIGAVNNLVQHLNTNLETLRSYAQGLGTNVALLNTRLDFTNSYMNLLNAGSGKLTLADLNQEGANLLALQTRQSLGIQSLSFAGQNEKSILQLFR
jgi:flagellin-like hook-associated protein FlgL